MTNTKKQKKREFDSRNYIAELVSAGFTIIPGLAPNRCSYGFVDSCVTSYTIHPCRDLETEIGRYLDNADLERENPNYSRFTVTYVMTHPSYIESAVRLKKTLESLGVAFSETPSREDRQKMAMGLEKKVKALKESLWERK